MEEPARLFYCGRCRAMVRICRRCDRGQVYCSPACSGQARRDAQRAAGQRYQRSRAGRFAHAARTRAWRARQRNVTHQGSEPSAADAVLATAPLLAESGHRRTVAIPGKPPLEVCCRCGRCCAGAVRLDFLGTRIRLRPPWMRR